MAIILSVGSYALTNPWISIPVLVIVCLILILFYVLGIFRPFGTPSPFKALNIRAPAKYVDDQAAREKVLKQGFTTKKIPTNLDAIIIGSGISSLTTAATLAKCGKRVLVLEQHDQAGGCCHTFHSKQFEFDVGIHYVGTMSYGEELRVLMDLLTDGQLQWVGLDALFDKVSVEGEDFPIYKYHEDFRDALLKRFPSQSDKEAIDKYVELLKEMGGNDWPFGILKLIPKWLARFLLWSGFIHKYSSIFSFTAKSLKNVLDTLTDNTKLKAVLSYNFGDIGMLPRDCSFYFHATVMNHFIKSGAFYPYGGSSEIAFHLIPTIQQAGGDVLVRANVTEILSDECGHVKGVRVQKNGTGIEVLAPIVVSGAGILRTKPLLKQSVLAQSSYFSKISAHKDMVPGHAAISLFVGLDGSVADLNQSQYNHWIFNSSNPDDALHDYLAKSPEDAANSDVPVLFASFPAAKDPTTKIKAPGKSTCTLVTFVNYEWFKDWEKERLGHRGNDYETFKNAIGQKMWEKCLQHYPQLQDKVEYFEVGSPVTNNYYLGSQNGEIYGMSHCMSRATPEGIVQLRAETDIPGFYITGQDIFTAGFAGAMFSGIMTSSAILGRNVLVDVLMYKLTEWLKNRYWYSSKFE